MKVMVYCDSYDDDDIGAGNDDDADNADGADNQGRRNRGARGAMAPTF